MINDVFICGVNLIIMKTKTILSILRVGSVILFWFLIAVSGLYAAQFIGDIYGGGYSSITNHDGRFIDFTAKNVGIEKLIYAKDHMARYQHIPNVYTIAFKSNSFMGYFNFFTTLFFILLGAATLWMFRKIFIAIKAAEPFHKNVIIHLKVLAAIFIGSDVLGFIYYFILRSYLRHTFATHRFDLIADFGSNIITGLIILVIAFVYQRAVEIQDENALTV